ncbi:MAG: ABC transporter ATP-binding protein, partial [Dermatophilaceae bacterium]
MTVEVRDLVKHFRVHRRAAGLRASLRGVVRREHTEVRAVDGVGFDIAEGEVVGFLGPNGAGKTTTLKCLSGLLFPTSGTVRVLGHEPFRREAAFLSRISLVMGQRNSLFWDLPALDAFEVHRTIYRVPSARYRATLDELVSLLELEPLLGKQVRVLSLGERMRCELAAALLHDPDVLFLDEPTLGL